ncbi:MAG TPA: glycosyltransferase, partial [Vulgatibacter sp.]
MTASAEKTQRISTSDSGGSAPNPEGGTSTSTGPMRRLAILAVTNIYPSASRQGAGSFVEQQVEGLRRIGARVEVVFIDRRTHGRLAYLSAHRIVAEAAARFRPDIVHAMYGGILGWQALRGAGGYPKVITFHGSDVMGAGPAGIASRLGGMVAVAASRRASLRADRVIAVSSRLASRLPAGVEPELIPCGIDLSRFRPLDRDESCLKLGWDPKEFHVVFQNNHGVAVKRQWLAEAAVEAARRLGVPARFQLLRGIPNADVPTFLSAGDCLLLTSSHEGSPTVVKEALACGLPVVSVDVGDVADRLAGVDGCHLEEPDPEMLARRLAQVAARACRVDAGAALEELSI